MAWRDDPWNTTGNQGLFGTVLQGRTGKPEGMRRGEPSAQDRVRQLLDRLLADPYSTEYEQAALARASDLASQQYKTLRQQRTDELARRGMVPESPYWQSEMAAIDRAQAQGSADFANQLQVERMNRQREALAQALQIELALAQMEKAGGGMSAGMAGGGGSMGGSGGGGGWGAVGSLSGVPKPGEPGYEDYLRQKAETESLSAGINEEWLLGLLNQATEWGASDDVVNAWIVNQVMPTLAGLNPNSAAAQSLAQFLQNFGLQSGPSTTNPFDAPGATWTGWTR